MKITTTEEIRELAERYSKTGKLFTRLADAVDAAPPAAEKPVRNALVYLALLASAAENIDEIRAITSMIVNVIEDLCAKARAES